MKLNNKGFLFYATQQELADYLRRSTMLELLSKDEANFFAGFSLQKRKESWLLGRYAAKVLVQFYWKKVFGIKINLRDIELVAEQNQKPKLHILGQLSPNIDISISHTKNVAVAAIAIKPHTHIGVDIESIKHVKANVSNYFLTNQELRQLNNNAITYWSIKEAALKALGIGLAGSLKGISVDLGTIVPRVSITKQNIKKSVQENPTTISATYGMIGKYTVATVFLEH